MHSHQLAALGLVVCATLLGGCARGPFDQKPTCPPPGSIQVSSDCTYMLTITNIDEKTGLVRATVARNAVEMNRKDSAGLFGPKFNIENYPFFEYTFPVDNLTDAALRKGADFRFISVRGTNLLRRQDRKDGAHSKSE